MDDDAVPEPEDQEDPKDQRTVQLTPRELQLLLKYGYPFPEDEQRLRDAKLQKGWHTIRIDAYWLSMWIGDLSRSCREVSSQSLREEIDALCTVLESAEHHDKRVHRVMLE